VLRRFLPSLSIDPADLDAGVRVQECIAAKTDCQGYEVNQPFENRKRYGNFLLDFFNSRRQTDVAGWTFNAVLLIKSGLVIHKPTGAARRVTGLVTAPRPRDPRPGELAGAVGQRRHAGDGEVHAAQTPQQRMSILPAAAGERQIATCRDA
jgi:hypothetical protein